jgi:hypothetical protein
MATLFIGAEEFDVCAIARNYGQENLGKRANNNQKGNWHCPCSVHGIIF